MVQSGPGAPTALVVSTRGRIEVHATWAHEGVDYVPVPPSHNLIRHGAIKLPGLPSDYESAKSLCEKIETYANRYLALSSDFLKVASSYVLLSWVYDAFNELPYLRFRGDYGSGKSRALLVFGRILYRGFFASGASTVSPIFHTLDLFKGSLVLDEADFRFTDEKSELAKILNNGNMKGFPVLRTQLTLAKDFEPRAFAVFGPKIVAMRGSYEDRALESRFLTEEMSGRALPPHVPISLPEAQEEEASALRAKLLTYRLRQRATVSIDASLADQLLEPRMNQILLALMSVAPTQEARAAILGYAHRMQAGIQSERTASVEGQVLNALADMLDGSEQTAVTLQDIVARFSASFGSDYDRPVTARYIGAILRNRLGLPLYKTNGIIAVSLRDRTRLDALFARYGIGDKGGERI